MNFDEQIDDLKCELSAERQVNADMKSMNALLYPAPEQTTRQFFMLIGGLLALALIAPYLP